MPLFNNDLPTKPITSAQATAASSKTRRYMRAQEKVDAAVTHATHVNADTIASRADAVFTAHDLQTMVDAIDPDFADFQNVVCRRTGQPLGTIAPAIISRTIRMHGREKARTQLEMQHVNHVAPHWVDTSARCLTDLSRTDPVAYFVYAAAKCAGMDGPYADAGVVADIKNHAKAIDAQAYAAGVDAIKKRHDDQQQYSDVAAAVDKGNVTALRPSQETHESRYVNVRTRARMFDSLDSSIHHPHDGTPTLEQVLEANELMRRLLALCHPRHLPQSDEWQNIPLYATMHENAMLRWLDMLRDFIGLLVKRHIARTFQHNKELQQMSVDRMVARLANMRVELGGIDSFHRQHKLREARADELALLELDDLFDTPISDSLRPAAKTRINAEAKAAARTQERAAKFDGKLHAPVAGVPFKLNIPGGNN